MFYGERLRFLDLIFPLICLVNKTMQYDEYDEFDEYNESQETGNGLPHLISEQTYLFAKMSSEPVYILFWLILYNKVAEKTDSLKRNCLCQKMEHVFERNQGKVFFYDLHIFPKQSASAACWNDSHKKVQFKQKKNLRWRRVHQWPQCCHKFATSPWDFFIPNSWKTIFKNHM